MKKDETEQYTEALSTEEETRLSRREYLIGLKKWSKVVIGSVLLSGAAGGCATAWGNSGGGSGWRNNASPWHNYSSGWRNSGGGWRNSGGGGGWKNNSGGGWRNNSGGGGGKWVNRRI